MQIHIRWFVDEMQQVSWVPHRVLMGFLNRFFIMFLSCFIVFVCFFVFPWISSCFLIGKPMNIWGNWTRSLNEFYTIFIWHVDVKPWNINENQEHMQMNFRWSFDLTLKNTHPAPDQVNSPLHRYSVQYTDWFFLPNQPLRFFWPNQPLSF